MRWPTFQFTIRQLMAIILVAALTLAPLPYALRNRRPEILVATGAYEIICLPAMSSLVALAVLAPGRGRTRLIVVLCAMPLIVIAVSYLLLWVVIVFRKPSAALELLITPRAVMILVLGIPAAFLQYKSWRCPTCGGRRLTALGRLDSAKRMWSNSGSYRCENCRAISRSEGFWPRLRAEG